MIRTYWYFAPVAVALGVAALSPYAAPLAVVGLALAIFFGTVSIRRHVPPRPDAPGGGSASLRASGPHPGA